jgi:hypothetical protein
MAEIWGIGGGKGFGVSKPEWKLLTSGEAKKSPIGPEEWDGPIGDFAVI